MAKTLCALSICNAAASRGGDYCWRHRKRKPMPAVNTKRKARVDAETFGEQAKRCRASRCCACGEPPPSDPHHEPSRGAGGKDSDTVPLCRPCHNLRHGQGRTAFEALRFVDLDEEKRRMQEGASGVD